ncbi:hypothetical protein [Bradyrhizobium viridifuturi]|uniref:hypothetical protein n=1 Tax=Bradyrhizobium viridifuturi TaxID=1654716 RepID=UPI000B110810|nr:hypothetical protein [Bradyrhizobium viridifuturi]
MAAGWMISIGYIERDQLRHLTYVVAVANAVEAIKASLDVGAARLSSGTGLGEMALANSELSLQQLDDLGMVKGEICSLRDDTIAPCQVIAIHGKGTTRMTPPAVAMGYDRHGGPARP